MRPCAYAYRAATLSAQCFPTASMSTVGGKESRTSCTPPTACFALSSSLIAPWVEVAGTVQYTSPLSWPKLTHGLNSGRVVRRSTKRCARPAQTLSDAPAGRGRLNENVDDVNPCAACSADTKASGISNPAAHSLTASHSAAPNATAFW